MIQLVWLVFISIIWLLQSSVGNFDIAGVFVLMYLWRQGSSLRLLTVFAIGLLASIVSGYWLGMWSLIYITWAGGREYLRRRYTINHWVIVMLVTSLCAFSSAMVANGPILSQVVIWNLLMLGYYSASRNWLEHAEMRLHYER